MKLAFAGHGGISGASAQRGRHFSKLGAALLASALMLPSGCGKKPEPLPPPPLHKVCVVRLSAPLDTLLRRMERGRGISYRRHLVQSYGQSAETGGARVLRLKSGSCPKKTVYEDVHSTTVRYGKIDAGYTAVLRAFADSAGTIVLDNDTLGTLSAALRAAASPAPTAIRWVLDYDTLSGRLAAIALPVRESGGKCEPVGRYGGGYLAAGRVYDRFTSEDSAVGRAPDGHIVKNSRVSDCCLGPLLFLDEGIFFPPDLFRLGLAPAECAPGGSLQALLAADSILSPAMYARRAADEMLEADRRRVDAGMRSRQAAQDRMDRDRAHGLGPRW